jgi:hemolysin III
MSNAFPVYSRGELIADGALHVLGVTASLIAAVSLVLLAIGELPPEATVSVLIYCTGLLAVFLCSAAYHLVTGPKLKALLRRFDHAAIYLKIAATYTPFAAIKMGGLAGMSLLGAVWVIAAIGIFTRLVLPGQFVRTAYVLYLAQGWACLAALRPFLEAVPTSSITLLLLGGILYTAGIAFHLWQRLPYHNFIWHAFVLAASACHFAAVVVAVVL